MREAREARQYGVAAEMSFVIRLRSSGRWWAACGVRAMNDNSDENHFYWVWMRCLAGAWGFMDALGRRRCFLGPARRNRICLNKWVDLKAFGVSSIEGWHL